MGAERDKGKGQGRWEKRESLRVSEAEEDDEGD